MCTISEKSTLHFYCTFNIVQLSFLFVSTTNLDPLRALYYVASVLYNVENIEGSFCVHLFKLIAQMNETKRALIQKLEYMYSLLHFSWNTL